MDEMDDHDGRGSIQQQHHQHFHQHKNDQASNDFTNEGDTLIGGGKWFSVHLSIGIPESLCVSVCKFVCVRFSCFLHRSCTGTISYVYYAHMHNILEPHNRSGCVGVERGTRFSFVSASASACVQSGYLELYTWIIHSNWITAIVIGQVLTNTMICTRALVS